MKNRGLAIFFGLIPGAGQMYMGKMRRGVTFMGAFFGIIGVAVALNIGFILLLLPIIWFCAFFDSLNLSALNEEQLAQVEDNFLFGMIGAPRLAESRLFKRKNSALGWSCIIFGVIMLYNTFAYNLISLLEYIFGEEGMDFIWSVYRKFPQLVIGVVIIVLGIRFIKGEKKPRDNVSLYKGAAAEKPNLPDAAEHPAE